MSREESDLIPSINCELRLNQFCLGLYVGGAASEVSSPARTAQLFLTHSVRLHPISR